MRIAFLSYVTLEWMNCETKHKTKQNVNIHLENEVVSIEEGWE